MASIAFTKVGNCILHVGGKSNPTDEEWDAYLSFLQASLMPGMPPRALVISDGAAPNSAQRQKLNKMVAEHARGLKVAVVTDSAIGRGVTTALSWFAKESYRAFSPAQIDAALDFLEINSRWHPDIKKKAMELKKAVT